MVTEFLVADVALIEPRLGMHRSPEAGFQIVCDHDVVTIVNEFIYGVAADVAGTA